MLIILILLTARHVTHSLKAMIAVVDELHFERKNTIERICTNTTFLSTRINSEARSQTNFGRGNQCWILGYLFQGGKSSLGPSFPFPFIKPHCLLIVEHWESCFIMRVSHGAAGVEKCQKSKFAFESCCLIRVRRSHLRELDSTSRINGGGSEGSFLLPVPFLSNNEWQARSPHMSNQSQSSGRWTIPKTNCSLWNHWESFESSSLMFTERELFSCPNLILKHKGEN